MQDEAIHLTDKQLCHRWQCSHMKLYRLRQRGLLKSMKLGGTGPYLTPMSHVIELEQRKETDMTDNADIADEMIEEGCPEQIATAIASLVAKGLVHDSGERRSGRIVWVAGPKGSKH